MLLKDGSINKKCKRIAVKYAKALDFAKTGVPASMDYSLTAPFFPDFLDKKSGKPTYVSKKALGYLFRNCKSLELGLFATSDNMEYKADKDLEYGAWQNYEESACTKLNQYKKEITSRLKRYELRTEGELLSGAIRQSQKLFLSASDVFNAVDQLEAEIKSLFFELQKEFFAEFGGKPKNNKFSKAMLEKASAWYMVTYSGNQNSNRFFGLPWAVSDVLLAIKWIKKMNITVPECEIIRNTYNLEKVIDDVLENEMPQLNLEENISIENYKNAAVGISHKVLNDWLNVQNLILCNREKATQILKVVLDDIFSELIECDNNYIKKQLLTRSSEKIMSPGHYMLKTLLQIAQMGISDDPNVSYSDGCQELGLFAWITLVKFGCSHSPVYLGLSDGKSSNSKTFYVQDDVIETILIDLTSVLSSLYIRIPDSLKTFLKNRSGVSDIDMNTGTGKSNYKLKITAKGSRFCIERLRDFIFNEHFLNELQNDKRIQEDMKIAEKNIAELNLKYSQNEDEKGFSIK